MNKKKVFIICFISFTILLSSLIAIFNYKQEKYNIVNINGMQIKGDTTRYPVKLVEKVDGDTIVVVFNNKQLKVRYLLVDTPETVKPGVSVQKYGPEASELNGEILKKSKNIVNIIFLRFLCLKIKVFIFLYLVFFYNRYFIITLHFHY